MVSRTELYEEVWTESILALSEKWDLPETVIRRLCVNMNVPLPPVGHWQKIKFGKPTDRAVLEKDSRCQERFSLNYEVNLAKASLKSIALDRIKEIEKKGKLVVAARLTNPHKMIEVAKNKLEAKDIHTDNGMMKFWRGIIDIKVTKQTLPRALRIMDAIVKVLEERGHKIALENDETFAVIMGQEIQIALREKTIKQKKKSQGSSYEYSIAVPTGQLIFKMEAILISTKEWVDNKNVLEDQIPEIIARLEMAGEYRHQQQVAREGRHEIQRKEEQLKKDYSALQEKDLINFKTMLAKSDRWHRAENLRHYIKEVETKSSGTNFETTDLHDWLKWAKEKADWFDPFIEASDELLSEIDRETLESNKKSRDIFGH